MLLELKVSHFAVIDKLEVHFLRPGLNILTGETGAGKSVLLKSLSLLLGGKASADVVRTGSEQAEIEGAFDLSARADIKLLLQERDLASGDDLLVVRRIINQSGKHRVYINGHLSTLNILEQVVPHLVEITGQHEHHSLTRPQSQIELLDKFGNTTEMSRQFSEKYKRLNELDSQLEILKTSVRDREQRMDFLRFQIEEIEAFKPLPGEDTELSLLLQKSRFAARLNNYSQSAESLLYGEEGGIHSQIQNLLKQGEELSQIDTQLKKAVQSLKDLAAVAEDAAFCFRDYNKRGADLTENEESSEKIAERLSDLKKLQRKYGQSIEEIIEFKQRAKSEFESLQSSEESIVTLEKQTSTLSDELDQLANKLHQARKKSAIKLATGVNSELKDLNMKGAEFGIEVIKVSQFQATGFDEVCFMIKPSPQDIARPLNKVASGGELSRIMLALKQVVAMSDSPMTYLFDEVDTGVSGPTAEKVGKKLKSIGQAHQVVSITHLPQVASYADAHFLITKEISKGFVKSNVRELNQKERIQEVGRLISGEKITSTSLAHAKQMLESSRL